MYRFMHAYDWVLWPSWWCARVLLCCQLDIDHHDSLDNTSHWSTVRVLLSDEGSCVLVQIGVSTTTSHPDDGVTQEQSQVLLHKWLCPLDDVEFGLSVDFQKVSEHASALFFWEVRCCTALRGPASIALVLWAAHRFRDVASSSCFKVSANGVRLNGTLILGTSMHDMICRCFVCMLLWWLRKAASLLRHNLPFESWNSSSWQRCLWVTVWNIKMAERGRWKPAMKNSVIVCLSQCFEKFTCRSVVLSTQPPLTNFSHQYWMSKCFEHLSLLYGSNVHLIFVNNKKKG